jgi:hypothetical protein
LGLHAGVKQPERDEAKRRRHAKDHCRASPGVIGDHLGKFAGRLVTNVV